MLVFVILKPVMQSLTSEVGATPSASAPPFFDVSIIHLLGRNILTAAALFKSTTISKYTGNLLRTRFS